MKKRKAYCFKGFPENYTPERGHFHYTWTILVLLKKARMEKKEKRSCNFLNCKKIFFLFLVFFSTWVSCCVISAAGAGNAGAGFNFRWNCTEFTSFLLQVQCGACLGLLWCSKVLREGRMRMKKNQARFLNAERVTPLFRGWGLLRALRKCLREEKAGALLQVKNFWCVFKETHLSLLSVALLRVLIFFWV